MFCFGKFLKIIDVDVAKEALSGTVIQVIQADYTKNYNRL
jgi:hypothetical protein